MEHQDWVREFPGAIVVCDTRGIIIALNDQAEELYRDQGGSRLLGTSVLDCHPEPSRSKLAGMLGDPRLHVYTTEKKGRRRLVYQTPWYHQGRYAGYIEMILDIPAEMPHFIRD